jgi:hypothetical protein
MQQEFRVDSSLRSTCDGNWDRLLRMCPEDTVEYLTEEPQKLFSQHSMDYVSEYLAAVD